MRKNELSLKPRLDLPAQTSSVNFGAGAKYAERENWVGEVIAVRMPAAIAPPAAPVTLLGWRCMDSLHARVRGYDKSRPDVVLISFAPLQTPSSLQDAREMGIRVEIIEMELKYTTVI